MKTSLRFFLLFFCSTLILQVSHAQEFRTLNGRGNNTAHPEWGARGALMLPLSTNSFTDSIGAPGGPGINARFISNTVFTQKKNHPSQDSLSDYVWAFGQFIDHDITLVNNGNELMRIKIPADDTVMRRLRKIFFYRSQAAPGTGTSPQNPRRYANQITAFIDGSVIYGSDIKRNTWLRTFTGGKMKVSTGNLLPWNTVTGEFNDKIDPDAPFMADDFSRSRKHFVTGDIRGNENPLLTTLQTLFVREHNRLCDELTVQHPEYNDEQLFQWARKIVGAILQNIVYREWLPAMGIDLPAYEGYKPEVDPDIYNNFAASAFRMGHTLINPQIQRLDDKGKVGFYGNLALEDGLFNPKQVLRTGITPYVRGMAGQIQQELDCRMIDGLRNFIFKSPRDGQEYAFDLAAINIARGRDRGVPLYNDLRDEYGMSRIEHFDEITSDSQVAADLEKAYGSVDSIDSWVGILAEDHMEGKMVGPLLYRIMRQQFTNLRDGDRFYFMNDPDLSDDLKEEIKNTSLKDVILRNTEMDCLQDNVFIMEKQEGFRCWPFVVQTDLDISITPMPIQSKSKLNIYSKQNQEIHARIINVDGREVWARDYTLSKGENHLNLEVSPLLPKGVYAFVIEQGEQYNAIKLFIH